MLRRKNKSILAKQWERKNIHNFYYSNVDHVTCVSCCVLVVQKYISQEAMQNSVVPEINYVAMLTASICGMVRTVRRLETDGIVTPRLVIVRL